MYSLRRKQTCTWLYMYLFWKSYKSDLQVWENPKTKDNLSDKVKDLLDVLLDKQGRVAVISLPTFYLLLFPHFISVLISSLFSKWFIYQDEFIICVFLSAFFMHVFGLIFVGNRSFTSCRAPFFLCIILIFIVVFIRFVPVEEEATAKWLGRMWIEFSVPVWHYECTFKGHILVEISCSIAFALQLISNISWILLLFCCSGESLFFDNV